MTPKLFLSEEDTNDNDYFYEIPAHVTHIDDNAIERLKKYYRSLLRKGPDHRLNKCDLNYLIAVK